jgi:hypothetical protein
MLRNQREILGFAPEWVPDSEAFRCHRCNTSFSFFLRRHHCRNCGNVYCNNCSSRRLILPWIGPGPVRVCEQCWNDTLDKLLPSSSRTPSSSSSSSQKLPRIIEDVVAALEKFGLEREDILTFASSLHQKGVTADDISACCKLLIKNAKPKSVSIQEYNKLKAELEVVKKSEGELLERLQKAQRTIEEKDKQLKTVTGICVCSSRRSHSFVNFLWLSQFISNDFV